MDSSQSNHDETCGGFLLLLHTDDELENAATRRIDNRRQHIEDIEERDRLLGIEQDKVRRVELEEKMRLLAEWEYNVCWEVLIAIQEGRQWPNQHTRAGRWDGDEGVKYNCAFF